MFLILFFYFCCSFQATEDIIISHSEHWIHESFNGGNGFGDDYGSALKCNLRVCLYFSTALLRYDSCSPTFPQLYLGVVGFLTCFLFLLSVVLFFFRESLDYLRRIEDYSLNVEIVISFGGFLLVFFFTKAS